MPVDAANRPLALDERWRANLSAQCWLWKDHTGWSEAAKITDARARKSARSSSPNAAGSIPPNGSGRRSGIASNIAPEVFEAAYSWVEIADWIPSVLAGVDRPARDQARRLRRRPQGALLPTIGAACPTRRSSARSIRASPTCATGSTRRRYDANDAGRHALARMGAKLGLTAGIPIAIGEFDVHYGAIGCGVREGTLVKVIGTSTCDCAVVSADKPVADIPGICGIVNGRDPARLLRHRGGTIGGRRHLQMVGRGRLQAATPRCMRS